MWTAIIVTAFSLSALLMTVCRCEPGCPMGCRCKLCTPRYKCKFQSCVSNNLQHVSQQVNLQIKGGSNTLLPNNCLPRVGTLTIKGDGQVDAYAWNKSANSLTSLKLENLQLKNPSTSFKILTALNSLEIYNTSIKYLKKDSFSGIKHSLDTLKMTYIDFKDWPIRLDEFTNLSTLTISYSDMSSLTDFPLPTLLTNLKIIKSRLSKIPKQFSSLTNITSVNFDDNFIKKIENLPIQLTRLDINYNNISEITKQSFPKNSQLSNIQMWSNKHANMTIERNAFDNVPGLRFVVLENATFNAPVETFTEMKNFEFLSVSSNYKKYCTLVNTKAKRTICA